VARHIFQACPVWIYTMQSNITNIVYTYCYDLVWITPMKTQQYIKAGCYYVMRCYRRHMSHNYFNRQGSSLLNAVA
jgi:hypothetical protein